MTNMNSDGQCQQSKNRDNKIKNQSSSYLRFSGGRIEIWQEGQAIIGKCDDEVMRRCGDAEMQR